MTEKLQQLTQLLTNFRQLPELDTESLTLLEIAGYPHYEEVCSNILAFYFDSNEDHGLGNLLLRSLLETMPCMESDFLSEQTNEVIREVLTKNSKRIDLIIVTDSYRIAIENKIFADLYNDLGEYSTHIERLPTEKLKPLKIVLSLSRIDPAELTHGFVNIIYEDLFQAIQRNIGYYLQGGKKRYIQYLLDFMTSIENLNGKSVKPEILDFFKDNHKQIQQLISYKKEIDKQRINRLNKIRNFIDDTDDCITQWVWRKYTLVNDIKLPEGVTIAVDYEVTLNGSIPEVFIRDRAGTNFELRGLSLYKGSRFDVSLEMDKNRKKEVIRIKDESIFNFETEPQKVAKAIKGIMAAIINT